MRAERLTLPSARENLCGDGHRDPFPQPRERRLCRRANSLPCEGCAEQEYVSNPPLQMPISNCHAGGRRLYPLMSLAAARASNASENSLEAVHQLLRKKRLAEKAGCAAGHRLFLDAWFGTGGDHDHRQRALLILPGHERRRLTSRSVAVPLRAYPHASGAC
jgi:hypothetical protein